MNNINLNYDVPITIVESVEEGMEKEFMIQGIAINSTITDNNHKFVSDELKKSVSSLLNRPLLKDHNDSVDSIIGRVLQARFNDINQNIEFQARVNNTEVGKRIKELIRAGDLNTVSVGATVKELTEEDGMIVPRGIKFKELSLVATPADDGAMFTFKGNTLDLALKSAWNKTLEQLMKCPECEKMIEKEKMPAHMKSMHPEKAEKTDTKILPELQTSQSITQSDFVASNQLNKIKKDDMLENKTNEVLVENVEDTKNESIDVTESRLSAIEAKVNSQSEILSQVLAGMNELKTSFESTKKVEEVKDVVTEAKAEEKTEVKVKESDETKTELEEELEEDDDEDVIEKNDYKFSQGPRIFTSVRNSYKYR